MSNFKFIEKGIDTKPFLDELLLNDHLWSMVSELKNIGGNLQPYGFLPLRMGVQFGSQPISDSEYQQDTPAKSKFPVLNQWLTKNGFQDHSRAAFFRLPPSCRVSRHIDSGKYYQKRDRYHLSLQGEYRYVVDDEIHIIHPGTFFWFDNKKPHEAFNTGNIDRITFVFDSH
jgi:quercetin dioxygenase-like cupin family protein